jgi:hypothetical protein
MVTSALGGSAPNPALFGPLLLNAMPQILAPSFGSDVIPLFGKLGPGDVVIDLGSGTGKLCWQTALQTGAGLVRGIEFASNRCDVADTSVSRALSGAHKSRVASVGPAAKRLFPGFELQGEEDENDDEDQGTAAALGDESALPAAASSGAAAASSLMSAAVAGAVATAATRVSLERGSFLDADLSDVTVAFINNTVFEPDLMSVSGCAALTCLAVVRRSGAL